VSAEPEEQQPEEPERLYYVSVVDAGRHGLLAGPYTYHAEALEKVDPARARAIAADGYAWFYAYGTCSIAGPPRKTVFGRRP